MKDDDFDVALLSYDPNNWQKTARDARRTLAFLRGISKKAAKPAAGKFHTDDSKREMIDAGACLQRACLALEKIFIKPMIGTQTERATHGYRYLHNLMISAFLIGSNGTKSQAVERYVVSLEKTKIGKARGQQKQVEADKWRLPFLAYAKTRLENNQNATYADIIRTFRKLPISINLSLPAENKDMSSALTYWKRTGKLSD